MTVVPPRVTGGLRVSPPKGARAAARLPPQARAATMDSGAAGPWVLGGWPLNTHGPAAPESIVAARACGGSLAAALAPLGGDTRNPPVTLGGTTVMVKDSRGVERAAPLDYVSALQVNYIV